MTNKSIFLVVFILVLFSGCKYEAGPFLSFVSLEHRIEGSYHVESATQNGEDQMNIIDELNIEKYNFYWVDDDPLAQGSEYGEMTIHFTDTTLTYYTHYTFESNNNELRIHTFGCFQGPNPVESYPLPAFLNDGSCDEPVLYWKIQRLTNKELWLSITFATGDYEVHLREN